MVSDCPKELVNGLVSRLSAFEERSSNLIAPRPGTGLPVHSGAVRRRGEDQVHPFVQ
jgi:hypothetical protein